jgi:lipoprotein-anchoring transpeptidase ErfK/SrfK
MLKSLQNGVRLSTAIGTSVPSVSRLLGGVYVLLTVAVGVSGCSDVHDKPLANDYTIPSGQTSEAASGSSGSASNGSGISTARMLPSLDPEDTTVEASRLRTALHREVQGLLRLTQAQQGQWISMVRQTLTEQDMEVQRAQLLVAVDRNPHVQAVTLIVAQPGGPWVVLGGTHVSTGEPNRRGYYITPTGVFVHTDSILDYRAQGTFNENHIRGLGLKGMRVWDFGWQWARKGWLTNGESGQIRLLMHSTDPTYLAHRIGRPASEGCIRVPADMNKFIDRHGVLDVDYQQAAIDDIAFRAILPRNAKPTPLAGDTLVVVDSSKVQSVRTQLEELKPNRPQPD